MKPSQNSVPVGWSSIIGWLASLGALAVCVAQSLEEAQPLLTGQNKTAGIVSAVILIATHLGRQYQGRPVAGVEPAPFPAPSLPPAPPAAVVPIEAAMDPAPTGVVPPVPPPAA